MTYEEQDPTGPLELETVELRSGPDPLWLALDLVRTAALVVIAIALVVIA